MINLLQFAKPGYQIIEFCHDLHLPRARTNWGKHRFVYHAVSDWNNLHLQIRQLSSLITFKSSL